MSSSSCRSLSCEDWGRVCVSQLACPQFARASAPFLVTFSIGRPGHCVGAVYQETVVGKSWAVLLAFCQLAKWTLAPFSSFCTEEKNQVLTWQYSWCTERLLVLPPRSAWFLVLICHRTGRPGLSEQEGRVWQHHCWRQAGCVRDRSSLVLCLSAEGCSAQFWQRTEITRQQGKSKWRCSETGYATTSAVVRKVLLLERLC